MPANYSLIISLIYKYVMSAEIFRNCWLGPSDNLACLSAITNKHYLWKCNKRMQKSIIELNHQEPWLSEIVFNSGLDNTIRKLAIWQPAYKYVLYSEVTRQKVDIICGAKYVPANNQDGELSILLCYHANKYKLIKNMRLFFGRGVCNRYAYCYLCDNYVEKTMHRCIHMRDNQCERCMAKYETSQQLDQHCNNKVPAKCQKCKDIFYGANCYSNHLPICRKRYHVACHTCKKIFNCQSVMDRHECHKYRCNYCKNSVERGHRCYIKLYDKPEEMTASMAGANYYAFDIESQLEECEDRPDRHVHEANLICVQQCFTTNKWHFNSLHEFFEWIDGTATGVQRTFFAHNFKGYDGRLIYEFLFENRGLHRTATWAGNKILTLHYGRDKFCDTLLHIHASLAQLPAMFGLDTSTIKKGFFPYLFNKRQNINYVGAVPDKKYFGYASMPVSRQKEFDEWYAEKLHNLPYNFYNEMLEYCESDTDILAKTIEAYMTEQMSIQPMNPFSKLTIASYAMAMYRTYYMPENKLAILTPKEDEDIRRAMHGGRTDCRRLLREWSDDEVARGIYGCYQDVQSLYPTVQFYDDMPVGPPKYFKFDDYDQPSTDDLMKCFGFVCCDIEPTRYMFHPLIVHNDHETGKLLATLTPMNNIVVGTPELHLALQHGYVIHHVHWLYHFEKSKNVFKDYFKQFIKLKLEASGVPAWAKNDPQALQEFYRYHRQELDIDLVPERMIKNNAKKTGAKLLCNSLWGKFGERYRRTANVVINTDCIEDIDKLRSMEYRNDIEEIKYVSRRRSIDGKSIYIRYNYDESSIIQQVLKADILPGRNIAIAAMVTCHARCRLWGKLNLLGERAIYHDTDSIIYEHSPSGPNIEIGKYLGEWEDECGGMPITGFVSTGPKCYALKIKNLETGEIKTTTKCKGIPSSNQSNLLINYTSMKNLVIEKLNQPATRPPMAPPIHKQIPVECLQFNYSNLEGKVTTFMMLKNFKLSADKGNIHRPTSLVYPFGADKYLPTSVVQDLIVSPLDPSQTTPHSRFDDVHADGTSNDTREYNSNNDISADGSHEDYDNDDNLDLLIDSDI